MIEKGYFFFELSSTEVLDLAELSKSDWREIEKRAKIVLAAKQTSNSKIAFVAAFMNFMMEKQVLSKPFEINA